MPIFTDFQTLIPSLPIMTPTAVGRILILGFRSISFLIREFFSMIVVKFLKVVICCQFQFYEIFPEKIISSLILRQLSRKMLSILILQKLFRKILSSLIIAKVILQDVVEDNFYEICYVKRFSSFVCMRAATRLNIATKLSQKVFSYPWD